MIDERTKREMRLSEEIYAPAIAAHQAGQLVTQRHPDTGETLIVESLPEIGVVIVRTAQFGVLMRVRHAPDECAVGTDLGC